MFDRNAAEALRQEHRIVRQLLNTLRSVVAVVPEVNRAEWLDKLRQNFARMRAHMRQHMKAEEADGFMGPVLDRRPTLSPEVRRLKDEHAGVAKWLDSIAEELASLTPEDDLLIEDACQRIRHAVSAIQHHEEQEELLVTSVFSQDLGSHD